MNDSFQAAEVVLRVLLVDDEDGFREGMAQRLQLRGFEVHQAADGAVADDLLSTVRPDVVVCDLKMPNRDGLTLLRRRIAGDAATTWIILTGQASIDTAVEGLKLGAADYLRKPIDVEDLVHHIRAAHSRNAPARTLDHAAQSADPMSHGLIGCSPFIREATTFIQGSADVADSVLITGECGTGKELVARAIHEQSHRRSRPFVAVNCTALDEALQAIELFGAVDAADGGGTKLGKIEMAHGGTLFIDEISDLTPTNQVAVQRLIDTAEVRRQGEARPRTVDVRIIASTFRDLAVMSREGAFRAELLHRLSSLPFHLQPLRQRREDVPSLIQYFLQRHGQRSGQPKRLAPDALVALQSYGWPGNVRELVNTIERAALLCDDYTITAGDLQLGLPCGVATAEGVSSRLADVEQDHILRVLDAHDGNKQAAARALGISRMKLYRKLEQYGVAT